MQAFQHLLHRIANAQRFAGGIGQRQRGRIQRRRIKMLRFQMASSSGSSRIRRLQRFAIGPANGTIAMQRIRL
jgi:hypothetical protein